MTAAITNFFRTVFGDNVVLATILIAMVPLIELKGAIPFAMSVAFWGERALNAVAACCFAFLGSIIVVPILALIFMPVYQWLQKRKFFNKIADFLLSDVVHKTQQTKQGLWPRILAVGIFVAFPVPLTGVWTGTCFAILLGLDFWTTCVTVISGNLICALIVAFICAVFPAATTILLYTFLAIIIIALIVKIILHLRRRKTNASELAE